MGYLNEFRIVSSIIRGNVCYQPQRRYRFLFVSSWFPLHRNTWSQDKKWAEKKIRKLVEKESYGNKIEDSFNMNGDLLSKCTEGIKNSESKAERKVWEKVKKELTKNK
jgi:hypothetical protein